MDLNTAQLTALAMARADVLNHWSEIFDMPVEKLQCLIDKGELPEITKLYHETVLKVIDTVYPVRDEVKA